MSRQPSLSFLAFLPVPLLLLTPCAGAETLTVGPLGSGAQYTDFSDAVLASQPHDTVLVLPGTYSDSETHIVHPLQIVGVGMPRVIGTGYDAVLTIDPGAAFGPGDFVLLAGLEIEPYGSPPFTPLPRGLVAQAPVAVLDCTVSDMLVYGSVLSMDGCSVTELAITSSEAWINQSQITGYHESFYHYGGGAGTPAASFADSSVSISRSTIVGGSAVSLGDCLGDDLKGAEALRVAGGTLIVRGGPGMLVQGGNGDFQPWCTPPLALDGGFAITTAQGAVVVVQDDTPLLGGMDGGGGQHAALPDPSGVTFTSQTYPSLALAQPLLDPGTGTSLSLAGAPGPAMFGMSPFTLSPLALPGIEGALHVDVARAFFFATTLPPSGSVEMPLGLPPDPALSGLLLVAQLATAEGPQIVLSDPALLFIR